MKPLSDQFIMLPSIPFHLMYVLLGVNSLFDLTRGTLYREILCTLSALQNSMIIQLNYHIKSKS